MIMRVENRFHTSYRKSIDIIVYRFLYEKYIWKYLLKRWVNLLLLVKMFSWNRFILKIKFNKNNDLIKKRKKLASICKIKNRCKIYTKYILNIWDISLDNNDIALKRLTWAQHSLSSISPNLNLTYNEKNVFSLTLRTAFRQSIKKWFVYKIAIKLLFIKMYDFISVWVQLIECCCNAILNTRLVL